jgi:hypothetical protein
MGRLELESPGETADRALNNRWHWVPCRVQTTQRTCLAQGLQLRRHSWQVRAASGHFVIYHLPAVGSVQVRTGKQVAVDANETS